MPIGFSAVVKRPHDTLHPHGGAVPNSAPSSGRCAGSPGAASDQVGGVAGAWRLPVPHAGSRPNGFPSVSQTEALQLWDEAKALSECESAADLERLIKRLAGTVYGLAAELEMRDGIGGYRE